MCICRCVIAVKNTPELFVLLQHVGLREYSSLRRSLTNFLQIIIIGERLANSRDSVMTEPQWFETSILDKF